MRPRAIISGGSIAGLSAAFWLERLGWKVLVLERAPSFREGGQNVDVRGVAREVVDRMGLFGAIKDRNTREVGTVVVNRKGGVVAKLPSDGPDGATAELEVLRGDLAAVIHEQLLESVEVRYGDPIKSVHENEHHVSVTTGSGWTAEADLLVVAEGVRSHTRGLVFDQSVLRELGITMAFGTIPRIDSDDDYWRWYNAPGRRQVHLRPDNHGTARAILAYAGGPDLAHAGIDQAIDTLRARFDDAGWQAQRVLAGFAESDDVYVDDLAQVRMPVWHRGRVCLLGDAAWCVTPIGGGGASLALTGAYVLAACLSTSPAADGAESSSLEIDRALDGFETWMRPLVDQVQKLPPGVDRIAYPNTKAGLLVRGAILKVITSPPVAKLAARQTQVADTDQQLPDMVGARAASD